jgi:hypothetical protein
VQLQQQQIWVCAVGAALLTGGFESEGFPGLEFFNLALRPTPAAKDDDDEESEVELSGDDDSDDSLSELLELDTGDALLSLLLESAEEDEEKSADAGVGDGSVSGFGLRPAF